MRLCPSTTCQAENSDPHSSTGQSVQGTKCCAVWHAGNRGKKQNKTNQAIRLKAEVMVSEEWHTGLVRATSPEKTTQQTRQEPQAGRNWMGADSSAAHKHPFVF